MVSWSGSSLWVSGMPSGGFLAPDRERRWPARVEEPVEVSGLETGMVVAAAELVAGAEEVWLTLGLDAGATLVLLAAGRGAGAGARVAA